MRILGNSKSRVHEEKEQSQPNKPFLSSLFSIFKRKKEEENTIKEEEEEQKDKTKATEINSIENEEQKDKTKATEINSIENEEQKDKTKEIVKDENFFIDMNEEQFHKVVKKIGEGATSIVYKVIDKRDSPSPILGTT